METLRLKEVSQLVRCPDFWGGGGGGGGHSIWGSIRCSGLYHMCLGCVSLLPSYF